MFNAILKEVIKLAIRDWQKDWEYLQGLKADVSMLSRTSQRLRKIALHWMRRVRELEVQSSLQNQGLPVKVVEVESEIDHIDGLHKDYFTEKMKRKDAENKCKWLEQRIQELERQVQELRRQLQEEEGFHKTLENAAADYIKELEQKIKKLEAVVEIVRECYQHWNKFEGPCSCDYSYKCRIWPKLRDALTTLEGAKD